MSRLNSKLNSLTQGNVNTHIFTEFSDMAKEETQKQMLQAIRDIDIDVGQIVVGDIKVESNDTITHAKIDTLNTTLTNKTLSKLTSSIDISGQSVSVSNLADVPLITGFSLDTTAQTTNDKLDTLNTTVFNKVLNKETSSIDISGQSVSVSNLADVPLITGFATADLQTDTNDVLNTISSVSIAINNKVDKIVDGEGDIMANIYYTQGAQVWADSTPIPTVNVLNPNGWLYTNTNAGNAMNLFYFNGANEIRTLGDVSGQYAVVSNLSTTINNKMIFAIYTKSGSSFFTTRVTHSQPSSANMVAGGKYLLYWGDAPSDLYPNLPRIELTAVVITGPAVPTEEVLAVSLNSDSGAAAGDLSISIEVLGVLFNGESRSYNLLGSPTEYETLVGIRNNTDDIKYKTNLLAFYNESGINELMTYDRASESNLIDIKNNSDKLKFIGDDLKTVISNTGFNVNNQITGFATQATLSDIKTNSDKLKYTGDDLKTVISNTGFNVNNINDTPLITGFATQATLSDIKTNSDKLKYTGDDLKAVISNTGFNVNNQITGFALEAGNLASIKTNTDKNKYVGDDLKAVLSNTGFNVNNQITGFALEAGNLASIKTNTDKNTYDVDGNLKVNIATGSITVESVNIKASNGDSLTATGTSLNTNITNTTAIPVSLSSGSVIKISDGVDTADVVPINTSMVGNQDKGLATVSAIYGATRNEFGLQGSLPITMTSITDAVPDGKNALDTYDFRVDSKLTTVNTSIGTTNTTLSGIKSQTDKLKFNGDNLKTEVSNQITGFATETTLGGIKTQTDKLMFNGDNLKTEIMNTSIIVEPGTNPLNVNIAGGSIGADGKAYLYSGNEASAITASTVDGKVGIDSNIINSSINTHIYGKTSAGGGGSGTYKEILITSQGELITESNMHSGIGVPLTSTSIAGVINNLDTASTLYSLNSGARTAITATGTSLNTNITNTVPVSGTFFQATQPVSIADTVAVSGTFYQATQPVSIASTVAVSGTFFQATQPVSIASTVAVSDTTTQGKIDTTNTTLSTINGKVPSGLSVSSSRLLTNSQLSAFNNSTSTIATLTSVQPSSTTGVRALDTVNYNLSYNEDTGVYVPISSKTIGSTYALNCYNVKAETKEYTFGGQDNNATAYRIIGGLASSSGLPVDLYDFGLANPRVYYASLSTGTPNTNLFIDYIDGTTGNLVESAVAFPVVATDNTTNWTLLPSMIGGPIKLRTSTSIGDSTNTARTLYISPITNTNRSICSSNIANYGIGTFTIPNGYIGYISALTADYSTVGSLILGKWGVNGVRQVAYKFMVGSTTNLVVSAGYEGTLGGIFTAGETLAFYSSSAITNKVVQASITLRKI